MAKARKFGTFSGVFTPSILTILGVIMYLRFPWIIGQAGLWFTLGIVIIAHIISITTGLSVASVATDKKVKTGGTYYMISRSLGLPIGGTLGIALFVGLSFSVSLYLIGFAESFLAYWGVEMTLDRIRITGTIILILVTIITFISTSLAIKSQYFIMTAIGLSLLSIFLGSHEFTPTKINYMPIEGAPSFMVLFGIFFPAVTGFEAGVSMSGDLRDPKKSLPRGAIMAIAVGFVAYIGLSLFYGITVEADALANDPQILFKISLVPELVIAGIWGATLSSALGSILGAPRILQATAIDKITPKLFAKGFGESNEPRNALLFTFIIAEAGILIGELDVIARIVSMFFITTYAFLNISCAIESWSSSDFRPAFKIPKFISIVGAIACIVVMIQLDFVALIGATVVLGLLFFYLKRKELSLATGDAWESFWARLVRKGLFNLSTTKANIRNWRPNIIMFSGGRQARPYMVDLGVSMAGSLGIVTDFKLIESNEQIDEPEVVSSSVASNVFRKHYQCDDIYQGIDAITSIYGFSGVEPNMVLMGWTQNTKNVEQFAHLIKKFRQRNISASFLKYNHSKGFGRKEIIDIWWRGRGRNLSFALSIARFMLSVAGWQDAKLRILTITDRTSKADAYYSTITQILDDVRINAEIEIINNEIEKRKPIEIIKTVSSVADLIFLGIAENAVLDPRQYIDYINRIADIDASLLLINSSTYFSENNIDFEDVVIQKASKEVDLPPIYEVKIAEATNINRKLNETDSILQDIVNEFLNRSIKEIEAQQKEFLLKYLNSIQKQIESFERNRSYYDKIYQKRQLRKTYNNFLFQSKKYFEDFSQKQVVLSAKLLETGISFYKAKTGNYVHGATKTMVAKYDKEIFSIHNSDKFRQKLKKVYYKIKHLAKGRYVTLNIDLDSYFKRILMNRNYQQLSRNLSYYNAGSLKIISEIRNFMLAVNDDYLKLMQLETVEEQQTKELINIIQSSSNMIIKRIIKLYMEFEMRCKTDVRNNISIIAKLLENNKTIGKQSKSTNDIVVELQEFSNNWKNTLICHANSAYIDIYNLFCKHIIGGFAHKDMNDINEFMQQKYLKDYEKLVEKLSVTSTDYQGEEAWQNIMPESTDKFQLTNKLDELHNKTHDIIASLPESIKVAAHSIENDEKQQHSELVCIEVPYKKTVKFEIETMYFEKFERDIMRIEKDISLSVRKIRENINILNGNRDSFELDFDGDNEPYKQNQEIFEKTKNAISLEIEFIKNALQDLYYSSENKMRQAFDNLNSYKIIHSVEQLDVHLREQKSRRLLGFLGKAIRGLFTKIRKAGAEVMFSRSSRLLNQQLTETGLDITGISDTLLKFTANLSPQPHIIDKLPLYYRNLFSYQSVLSNEMSIDRTNEIENGNLAVLQFRKGKAGALLITGNAGSGKSVLAMQIARRNFQQKYIVRIIPPHSGSVKKEDFIRALHKATGIFEKPETIFRSLSESVIIIDDFELWWLRKPGESEVINLIIKLIRMFSTNHLFMIVCNETTIAYMKNSIDIENHISSVVYCPVLSSKQIHNLIINRHKSGSLKFVYNKKSEQQISFYQLARLFNIYFRITKGNANAALNAWLISISKVENDTLFLQKPQYPDLNILYHLSPERMVFLTQLVLHKKLSISQFKEIFDSKEMNVENILNGLQNISFLEVEHGNIYYLNKYIEPYLIEFLKKNDIIPAWKNN